MNELTVAGTAKDVAEFVTRTQGPKPRYKPDDDYTRERPEKPEKSPDDVLSFNALVPISQASIDAGYNGKNNPDVLGGYYAEQECWGVKWGAYHVDRRYEDGDAEAGYVFTTAWGPPAPWLAQVAEMFPRLCFNLTFNEPGMCFMGEIEWRYGDCMVDTEREMTATDLKELYGWEEEE